MTKFNEATLKNAFNSLAGLLIVTAYYYKKEIEIGNNNTEVDWMNVTEHLEPQSNLFKLKDDYYHGTVRVGRGVW